MISSGQMPKLYKPLLGVHQHLDDAQPELAWYFAESRTDCHVENLKRTEILSTHLDRKDSSSARL